jgi:hypothetical protein
MYSSIPFQQVPGCSIWQVSVHQSPFRLFQSSHCSPASFMLFQQIGSAELHHQLELQAVVTTSHIFLLVEKVIVLVSNCVHAVFHLTDCT